MVFFVKYTPLFDIFHHPVDVYITIGINCLFPPLQEHKRRVELLLRLSSDKSDLPRGRKPRPVRRRGQQGEHVPKPVIYQCDRAPD